MKQIAVWIAGFLLLTNFSHAGDLRWGRVAANCWWRVRSNLEELQRSGETYDAGIDLSQFA